MSLMAVHRLLKVDSVSLLTSLDKVHSGAAIFAGCNEWGVVFFV